MTYEIVNLEEKTVVGVTAKTNNQSPDMGQVIGGLWDKFYQPEVYSQIPGKVSDKALGIYTDYEADEKADYSVVVAYETDGSKDIPADTVMRTIPAGRYAKFIVKGHMQRAVAEFWGKLWEMNLPRAFSYDFEEYQNADMEQAEIHIYISLKEE